MQNIKKNVFYALYNKSFDTHTQALQMVKDKKYFAGERERILKQFPKEEEKNFILNSPYFIEVENVEKSLKKVLKESLAQENMRFKSVAITGTCGKTSVLHLASQLVEKLSKKPMLKMGTLGIHIGNDHIPNTYITTPDYLTFCRALHTAKQKGIDTFFMEMSSHALATSRLEDYLFSICVFTNLSQEHLDFHGTMEEYLAAKTLLFTKNLSEDGTCIVSTKSPEWISVVKHSAKKERSLYIVDLEEKAFEKIHEFKNDFHQMYVLQATDTRTHWEGISANFHLYDSNKTLQSFDHFSTSLIGETNLENSMFAYCICLAMGYPSAEFISHFQNLVGTPGRMQKVCVPSEKNQEKPYVIVDYAHKPGALESVLKTLRALGNQKLITVFGCGGERDQSKRPIMGRIALSLSDVLIVTSDNPRSEDPHEIIRQIVDGMENKNFEIEMDRGLAIQRAFEIAKAYDVIVIAGRGNETHQIIGKEKIKFSDIEIAKQILEK